MCDRTKPETGDDELAAPSRSCAAGSRTRIAIIELPARMLGVAPQCIARFDVNGLPFVTTAPAAA